MTLEELIYTRLVQEKELAESLAKYEGVPAVFLQKAPDDKAQGWGVSQYPRADYLVDMTADPERHSSGNKQLGTRVAESVDAARYRAQLIYEATVEEDRDKIWDNRDAWKNLNVLNGTDLVEVVLKSGEKDEILAKLDEISGYQPTMEDVAKN